MPDPRDVRDEQIRMNRLRVLVDLAAYGLRHAAINHEEARSIVEHARTKALELFPDKGDVFDLVVRPRFDRIINERALATWNVADSLN